MPDNIVEVVKRFLHYAFEDIDYQYRFLTPQEKTFCTKEEFEEMMAWLRAEVRKEA